jgi:hypothetical protein
MEIIEKVNRYDLYGAAITVIGVKKVSRIGSIRYNNVTKGFAFYPSMFIISMKKDTLAELYHMIKKIEQKSEE